MGVIIIFFSLSVCKCFILYTPTQNETKGKGCLTMSSMYWVNQEIDKSGAVRWACAFMQRQVAFTKYIISSETNAVEDVNTVGVFHESCWVMFIADSPDVLSEQIDALYSGILQSISKYSSEGCRWIVKTGQRLEIVFARYQPL